MNLKFGIFLTCKVAHRVQLRQFHDSRPKMTIWLIHWPSLSTAFRDHKAHLCKIVSLKLPIEKGNLSSIRKSRGMTSELEPIFFITCAHFPLIQNGRGNHNKAIHVLINVYKCSFSISPTNIVDPVRKEF